jgi:metallopeptidase MepB
MLGEFLVRCVMFKDDANQCSYYGYLSSQVYSTDMFYSVFKADPMNGKEGRRYRHTVLERGGSKEEMEILEEFLGRKPETEAFYKELGIGQ